MAVSGLLGKRNLGRLQLDVQFPEEIFARQPTLLQVSLENRRRYFPAFLVEVSLGGESVLFPLLPAGARMTRSVPCRFARRGHQPLPELRLASCFPVNFFSRYFQLDLERQALVFPAPYPGRLPTAAGERFGSGEQSGSRTGFDGDLHTINDYHGGAPLKSIHWKLSARQDQLKIKQHAETLRPPVLITLEQLPGGIEERLGRACHLVVALLREERPVGLRLGDREIPAASGHLQRLKLLRELAVHGLA